MTRKKAPMLLLLSALLLFASLSSRAEDTRTRKLGRGFTNLLFGVVEIPRNMIEINKSHGGMAGLTWGLFRGVQRFAIREYTGVKEIGTFWTPDGAKIDPEFIVMPDMDTKWKELTDDDRMF